MAYVIGASHNLVGAGIIAVSNAAGLIIRCTAAPSRLSERFTHPATIYGLGTIRVGDPNAWLPARALQSVEDLVYPLPIAATRVGFDLSDGVAAQLLELTDPSRVDLVDRHPTIQAYSQVFYLPGLVADTLAATWTVPAARRMALQSARIQVIPMGNPGAYGAGAVNARIQVVSVGQVAQLYGSGPQPSISDAFSGELYLASGQVVQCYYGSSVSATGYYVLFNWSGVLFDA